MGIISHRRGINIGAGTLARPIENVCATLLHEMCHYFSFVNGVQDCSRGNTYHNKRFKSNLRLSASIWAMRVSALTAFGNGTPPRFTATTDLTLPLSSGFYSTAPPLRHSGTSALSRNGLKRQLKGTRNCYEKGNIGNMPMLPFTLHQNYMAWPFFRIIILDFFFLD